MKIAKVINALFLFIFPDQKNSRINRFPHPEIFSGQLYLAKKNGYTSQQLGLLK